MAYLARKREKIKEVPPDHWALLATERLLKHSEKLNPFTNKNELYSHAVKIVESLLKHDPDERPSSEYHGALTPDYRTTPTATRLEGLLAALSFLPDTYNRKRGSIENAVHEGIYFLLRASVNKGKFKGGMPRKFLKIDDDGKIMERNLKKRDSEIRIDYVQHALSAMMQYEEMFRHHPYFNGK
jgi:hypothetical protein